MSPTVHEIRNAIRSKTGRFEREVDASFTKEELQAICGALGVEVDQPDRPSTTRMRRQIRTAVGIGEGEGGTFRKADLEAIAEALGASVEG